MRKQSPFWVELNGEFNEHLEGDGTTVFAHACKMGLEGIVSKRKDSAYRSGMAFRHGLRASELCSLRWEQVDLVHGRLHGQAVTCAQSERGGGRPVCARR
jgi:integrase